MNLNDKFFDYSHPVPKYYVVSVKRVNNSSYIIIYYIIMCAL